jgi:hypothetical protein
MLVMSEFVNITPVVSYASAQGAGHSIKSALKEFFDNCWDADATWMKFFVAKDINDKPMVIIADNGIGLDESQIVNCIRSGYTSKRSNYTSRFDRSPIGKFGHGGKNAVAKLASNATIISRSINEASPLISQNYNQKEIQKSGEWIVEAPRVIRYGTGNELDEWHRSLWANYMKDDTGLATADHGTMIVLRNLTPTFENTLRQGMSFDPAKNFEKSYGCLIGETYNKMLTDDFKAFIGISFETLVQIKPLNPVALNNLNGLVNVVPTNYLRETKTFNINGYDAIVNLYSIDEVLHKDKKTNSRPMNNQNSGIYAYRNDRLHLCGLELPMQAFVPERGIAKLPQNKKSSERGIFPESHGRNNNVRVELIFPSQLDDVFGVNVNKTEISFTDDASDLAVWIWEMVRFYDKYDLAEREGRKVKRVSTPAKKFSTVFGTTKRHTTVAQQKAVSRFKTTVDRKVASDAIATFISELSTEA